MIVIAYSAPASLKCDMTQLTSESNRPKSGNHSSSLSDGLIALSILGDLIVIFAGLCLGYWIRFDSGWIRLGNEGTSITLSRYISLITIGTIFLVITFAYLRLYEPRKILNFRQILPVILQGTTFWLFAYLGLSLALRFEPAISRIYVLSSFVSALIAMLVWRFLLFQACRVESIARSIRQRVLFVGWNEDADRLANAIQQADAHPYEIAGCVATSGIPFQLQPPPDIETTLSPDALDTSLRNSDIDIVVLADPNIPSDEIQAIANACEQNYVQFKVVPSYFEIFISGLQLETISGVPVLGITELPLDRIVNRLLKRAVDILGSTIGLAAAIPLIAVFGTIVFLESPGPILFRQERIGRNGKRFNMLKIRSMKLGSEKTDNLNQSTLREDPRMLRIGQFMRRWNIDELPQFWNAFRGQMSLVGPRPERTFHSEMLSRKIPHYNARYACKPGITGWAQVNGLRGNTSLTERIKYDLFYLENWSLWLDFQIMLLTFFKRDNAY